MSPILNFLQSEHILAFLVAVLIFLTTILLVVKRWIGFSIALLLLLFSLAAGLVINYQQEIQHYFNPAPYSSIHSQEDFHKYMLQGMENLKTELTTEKDNLRRVMNQVQEIFESMDVQKQKLQNFIEEVKEQFKTDYPVNPTSSLPSETSSERPSETSTSSDKVIPKT